jgi:hypothetical protein
MNSTFFLSDGRSVHAARFLVLVLAHFLLGCGQDAGSPTTPAGSLKKVGEIAWVSELNRAENLILQLTPQLNTYSEQVTSRRGPEVDGAAVSGWQPLLDQMQSFEHAKFNFVAGEFSRNNPSRFETLVNFEGLATTKSGRWSAIRTKQKVVWAAESNGEQIPGDWKVIDWEQPEFQISERDQLMFRDVTTSAIPAKEQPSLLKPAHDQFIVRSFRGEKLELPYPELEPYFSTDATMCHPSVSVVDINGDGWDDLYLMTRWEKNRLFVNQQDGTFKNEAERYGLDIGLTSCAIFADFDNDGDKDVFLGRCFESSLLLVNEDGKFVDRTKANIAGPLPGFITSASAADYNNDGQLDLYLCSYTSIGSHIGNVETAAKFMPVPHAEALIDWFTKASPADLWLDRPGPPNRLLKNVGGGKFKKSAMLQEVWANTFQSTWSDYDQDGDVDLYLSNDFAPDYLFRNDGELGFSDVTLRVGGKAMRGYGMGVTWGDYDGDGWQDLYVSNMYSKAGKRIIGQMQAELDERYLLSANGNRLFKNQNGRNFDLVSGEGPTDIQVTKAGWSWGGQFCDFDNDGWLDLYVASGFYTAPQEITCHTDL